MSMLAEPRKKIKYGTNPRGELWCQDETKVGQKLMEKMGWSKGKGLGANEDGNTDHISVKVKQNTYGVGCNKKHADNWIAHQDDFNSLLSDLNSCSATDSVAGSTEVTDLEMKSKTSKSRVHYMKFAKGKNLAMRKSEEMDCIFGRRKSNSNTPTVQSENNSAANSDDDAELRETFGVQTVKAGQSVQEYFAEKMANLKKNQQADGSSGTTEDESVTVLEKGGSAKKLKKNKKMDYKISDDQIDSEVPKTNTMLSEIPDTSESIESVSKSAVSKSKKKDKRADVEVDCGISEQDSPKPKRSKKKRKCDSMPAEPIPDDDEHVETQKALKPKKSKKKKPDKDEMSEKDENKSANHSVEALCEEKQMKSAKTDSPKSKKRKLTIVDQESECTGPINVVASKVNAKKKKSKQLKVEKIEFNGANINKIKGYLNGNKRITKLENKL